MPMPPRPARTPAADQFEPGFLSRLRQPPRKVVLVRASRIGDFVCATPAFRALRRALPDSEISLVALPFVRDAVHRSPALDRFIEFPGFPGIAEQFFRARGAAAFFARMQEERFDLAIQMHGSGVYTNPFTLMLGAAYTAGFVRPGDAAALLDAALPVPEGLHEVARLLALTDFLGARREGEWLEFPLREGDRAAAAELIAGARAPLIGLHPGAREATKRWGEQRFAAAATMLAARLGGTTVVLGGDDERGTGARIVRAFGGAAVDVTGRTAVAVLGAVIERLSVLVTNDSAPAHLAYALGTPSVTVFGGTEPWRWGPPRSPAHAVLAHPVPCRPCSGDHCPIGFRCLEAISPGQVAAAAMRCIEEGRAAVGAPVDRKESKGEHSGGSERGSGHGREHERDRDKK